MTQGGPAFLTSDITRWECAPHKNTNKMSWRAGGGGRAAGRCSAEPPGCHSPGTGCTPAGRARPQPGLPAQSWCLGGCPASPPALGKVTCCGSESPTEAAGSLPKISLGILLGRRCPRAFCKGLRGAFAGGRCLLYFLPCFLFLSHCPWAGSALALPWPWSLSG